MGVRVSSNVLTTCGFRTALLGTVAGAIALAALPAQADTATEIVITGSRIPQANLTSTSPIQSVTDQEFKLEGRPKFGCPQSAATDYSAEPPSTFRTRPIRLVGARWHPPPSTFVVSAATYASPLLTVSASASATISTGNPNPAPDIDQIPSQLVQRVDVVTGGASAVYGSDAVAGVVNFIMKHDFEGNQIDGQFGWDTHTNDLQGAHDAINTSLNFGLDLAERRDLPEERDRWARIRTSASPPATTRQMARANVRPYFSYSPPEPCEPGSRDFSDCPDGRDDDVEPAFRQYCAIRRTRTAFNNATTDKHSPSRATSSSRGQHRRPNPPTTFNSSPFQYLSRDDSSFSRGLHVSLRLQ